MNPIHNWRRNGKQSASRCQAGELVATEAHREDRSRHGRATTWPRDSTPRRNMQEWQAAMKLILLWREQGESLEQTRPPRAISPDPLDVAKELEEEQVWVAVVSRCDELQGQIKEAVRLLGEGRYGRCVECGVPIPCARLRALPFAVRCLACQECVETQSSQLAVSHSWA